MNNSRDEAGGSTPARVGRSTKLAGSLGAPSARADAGALGAQTGGVGGRKLGLSSLHTSPQRFVGSEVRNADGQKVGSLSGSAAIEAAALEGRGVGPANPVKVRSPLVRVAVGGNLMQVRAGRVAADVPQRHAALRGLISGFSGGSRRRLMYLLQSINQSALAVPLPLFLTLTYPRQWPSDPAVWKKHLDTFAKRLTRKFPRAVAVWRLEFQKRGAPHYHLILFNVGFVPNSWLARAWYEVVGSGDVAHLKAGTEVRRVRSWRGVMSYAAKYVTKPQAELLSGVVVPEHVGRWWGVLGRANLPIVWHEQTMTFSDFYAVRRVLRGFLRSRGVRAAGRSAFAGLSAFLASDVALRLLQSLGVNY